MPWDDLSQRGNPTCSAKVNKLIKAMIRKEVARLGRKSMAWRPFEPKEFEALVEAISREETSVAVLLVTYIVFQYAMIANGTPRIPRHLGR